MEVKENDKANINVNTDDTNNIDETITVHHIGNAKPQQVLSILWCPRIKRFVHKSSPNHISLKLEIESLHGVDLTNCHDIIKAKDLVTKEVQRTAMDNTNCLDTGVSITLGGGRIS